MCLVNGFANCIIWFKLNFHQLNLWLKKLPARKLQIEDNTNNENKRKVQENVFTPI